MSSGNRKSADGHKAPSGEKSTAAASNKQPTKVTEAMARLRMVQDDLRVAVNTLEGLEAGNPDDLVILAASEATDIVAAAIEKINAVVGICASASDVAKQPFDNTVD